MSSKKEKSEAPVNIKVPNEVLLGQEFTATLVKVCKLVWGRQEDDRLFLLLDDVNTKQTHLGKLRQKYIEASGIKPNELQTPEMIAKFNEFWTPLVEDSSEIESNGRLVLYVKEGQDITALDRLHLKHIIEFKTAKEVSTASKKED